MRFTWTIKARCQDVMSRVTEYVSDVYIRVVLTRNEDTRAALATILHV